MITIDELIRQLENLKEYGTAGDTPVLIDDGMALREVEEVDLDASSLDVVIWVGSVVES